MKKFLTLFSFAAALTLGIQSASAQELSQDQNRPEVIAKEKTHLLTEDLGLNGDQTRALFRAMVAKEVGYQKHVEGKDLSSVAVKSERDKIDAKFKQEMKKILDNTQYEKWSKDN